jgi:hypothetical protein
MLYLFDPGGQLGPPYLFPVHTPSVPRFFIDLNAFWIHFAITYLLYIASLDSDIQPNQFPLHGYQLPECYVSHPPDEASPNTVTYGKLDLSFSWFLFVWQPSI